MPRLVRSAALSNYVDVARAEGLDPYRMVAEFGLPPAVLTDPEVRVSAAAVSHLLEHSARRSGRTDFGLRLAEKRSLANLGPLALLVREQPTVRKALEALVDFMHLHSEALRMRFDERGGVAVLSVSVELDRPAPVRQGIELSVGFQHRSLQHLLGKIWRPTVIRFAHPPPPRRGAHQKFFGATVEFDQDYNGIECVSQDLDAALPASDAGLARHVRQYIDTLATKPNATMSASVRDCILILLPTGRCSADHVAQHLGVDRRTVHRHLFKEGQTFSGLVDLARRDLATRYVANSDRQLTHVAEQLGFSSLSAFSRWFRDKFGLSVTQWRTRELSSQGIGRRVQ